MAKDTKNINVEVSLDTWKKLSIMSIQKGIHLKYLVSDILDKVKQTKQSETEELS